ncbi:hypothetical protein [Streptosporangium saharense]|uniref:hypothetical protein n=1 Tax=Streptosporangium saharense TaxID=1706840 RepID=UPI0036AFB8B0
MGKRSKARRVVKSNSSSEGRETATKEDVRNRGDQKKGFGWAEKIAAIGTFVAALAAIPSYLALNSDVNESSKLSGSPTPVRPAVSPNSSTTLSPVDIVIEFLEEYPECGSYLIGKGISEISNPPFAESGDMANKIQAWVRKEKAVAAYGGLIAVSVRGTSASPVFLTGLKVNVIRRDPPLGGTMITNACGNPISSRGLSVELDHMPPKINQMLPDVYPEEGSPKWKTTPLRFPYQVTDREGEIFLILPVVKRCSCTWTATLNWNVAGRVGSAIIDNKGQPFRTVAPGKVANYYFTPNGFVPG